MEQIGIALAAVAILDFLFAGKAAALSPSVGYRPFSKLRWITLLLLAAAAVTFAMTGLRKSVAWPDWVLLLGIIIWAAGITADLQRQRERGPLPKSAARYSEVDADY